MEVHKPRPAHSDIVTHVTPLAAAVRELGVRVVLNAKTSSEFFASSGPSRVVEQLRRLPMAASCLLPRDASRREATLPRLLSQAQDSSHLKWIVREEFCFGRRPMPIIPSPPN